jgi:cell division protein FtsA
MVGVKNAQGKLYILADEVEDSASCIQRGCVLNVNDTALRIHRLIKKLQTKLSSKIPDFQIDKVYVGVGGQSLHSVEHFEMRTLNTNAVVTDEDIRGLDEQCKTFKPETFDVLGVTPPTYYADGKITDNPVGIPCKRIEAHYKLIVGQPNIKNYIKSCFDMFNDVQLAGIIVSPLSLAETMLGRDEKELGCVMIDFGAGTTSVVVYKRNKLAHLCVIPLGSDLITKDLTNLPFVESDAERLKIKYGSAVMVKDKENPVLFETKDGIGIREFNTVVEARAQEIVENVCNQVKLSKVDSLGAGVFLAGRASALNNLQELIQEKLKQEVRYSTIQKEWMENEDERMGNPQYMNAISLLIKGTENCLSYIPPLILDTPPVEDPGKGKKGWKKGKGNNEDEQSKGGNFFKKLFDSIVDQE